MFEIELFRKLSNISQLGKNPRRMIQIDFETEFFSVGLDALVITKSNRFGDSLQIPGQCIRCSLVRPTENAGRSITGEDE